MKIHIVDRGTGSTTHALRECAKHGYQLVCGNDTTKHFAKKLIKEMGLNILEPTTFYDLFISRDYVRPRSNPAGYIFDNFDIALRDLFYQFRVDAKEIILCDYPKDTVEHVNFSEDDYLNRYMSK